MELEAEASKANQFVAKRSATNRGIQGHVRIVLDYSEHFLQLLIPLPNEEYREISIRLTSSGFPWQWHRRNAN